MSLANNSAATWTPAVQAWQSLFAQYGGDLDSRSTERLLRWAAIESGGNPCSIDGSRKVQLAQGWVPDVGVLQLYFETQTTQIGGHTSDELRAGCVGVSQIASNVTDATRDLQASVSIQWLRDQKATIDAFLSSQGVNWSERDRWRYYKLVLHGLPALGYCAMYTVVAQLGRGPNDWDEFRSTFEGFAGNPITGSSVLDAAAADTSVNNRCTSCIAHRYLWSIAWHNAEEMDLGDESVNGALVGSTSLDIPTILAFVGLAVLYWFYLR